MMLKLEFTEFQRKLVQNSPVFPTVHYMDVNEQITLCFLSGEGWQYYTTVTYEDIRLFSTNQSISYEEAIEMFTVNYLSNAVRIEPQYKNELYLKELEESVILSPPNNQDMPELLEDDTSSPLVVRSLEISSGNDIVEEATGYSDFLFKLFNSFEKKVLSSVDKIQLSKEYTVKSFGDFLKDLFNTVNTVAFATHVKRYIRMDLLSGLEASEEELGVDIGYTKEFQTKLAQLQNQQISGYTINGKKWFGIKGVTKELQSDIIQLVQNGINDKKSTKEIKEAISSKFDTFSDWRSNMIARTETTRIINEGKMLGYKESGLEGNKVWITAPYEPTRSSEICQRLKNQEVPLDDLFIDPDTRMGFMTPPAHPNCRSRIIFKPI